MQPDITNMKLPKADAAVRLVAFGFPSFGRIVEMIGGM
jgi:hypothetical protein